MKILVLAPHPFYQGRGTPIAVDILLRCLSERGDEVDLVTFHEGSDRFYERVQIHRIKPIIGIHGIRPGLSMKKIYCDLHLFFRFISLIRKKDFDLIHAVEEGAFMAWIVCAWKKKPFIYDMDSSMSTQVVNKLKFLRPFMKGMQWLESQPIRRAAAVVPVCTELARNALRCGAKQVVVLPDISLMQAGELEVKEDSLHQIRKPSQKIAMYIGNLEPYQGIDLMLESFALVRMKTDTLVLVVIGGAERDIGKYRARAEQLGIQEAVHFLGPRPIENLGQYIMQANILVSPRTEGVNTPMKLYSYLDSGIPVLATDLPTHTQVVNSKMAMLAAPEKEAFAQAMLRLIEDEPLGSQLAWEAKEFVAKKYSYDSFKNTLHGLYARLETQICN
jgi:glycosyltransferase involved in cell wall biosynthesis